MFQAKRSPKVPDTTVPHRTAGRGDTPPASRSSNPEISRPLFYVFTSWGNKQGLCGNSSPACGAAPASAQSVPVISDADHGAEPGNSSCGSIEACQAVHARAARHLLPDTSAAERLFGALESFFVGQVKLTNAPGLVFPTDLSSRDHGKRWCCGGWVLLGWVDFESMKAGFRRSKVVRLGNWGKTWTAEFSVSAEASQRRESMPNRNHYTMR